MAAINQTTFSNERYLQCCTHGSNQQYSSIGGDNGSVPARQQAIIWTNDG